jgi:uncharacterized RDD family membrane protein YckC
MLILYRSLAFFIDILFILLIGFALYILLFHLNNDLYVSFHIIYYVLIILYFVFCDISTRGQTVGKAFFGIKTYFLGKNNKLFAAYLRNSFFFCFGVLLFILQDALKEVIFFDDKSGNIFGDSLVFCFSISPAISVLLSLGKYGIHDTISNSVVYYKNEDISKYNLSNEKKFRLWFRALVLALCMSLPATHFFSYLMAPISNPTIKEAGKLSQFYNYHIISKESLKQVNNYDLYYIGMYVNYIQGNNAFSFHNSVYNISEETTKIINSMPYIEYEIFLTFNGMFSEAFINQMHHIIVQRVLILETPIIVEYICKQRVGYLELYLKKKVIYLLTENGVMLIDPDDGKSIGISMQNKQLIPDEDFEMNML